jgi:hypothetical protein
MHSHDVVGEGAVLSGTAFQVPPPDVTCSPADHARSITLSLRRHLVAQGRVSSIEDPPFTDCVASVPVKIQRRVSARWGTVGRTTTTDTGSTRSGSRIAQASTGPWLRRFTSSMTSVSAPSHPFEGTTSRLLKKKGCRTRVAAPGSPSPDALGVVRNLPGAIAGAALHPRGVPAPPVLDLQEDPEESRIARVTVLALARVAEGRRVIGVEPTRRSASC